MIYLAKTKRLCIVVSSIIVYLKMHLLPLTNCPELEHLSLHHLLVTGCLLVGVSLVRSLKSNVCTALTTQNTKGHNCLIIQAKKRDYISAPYFFNSNTWFACHTQRTVGTPYHKTPPRSSPYLWISDVNNCRPFD